jgi:hypothetical protein
MMRFLPLVGIRAVQREAGFVSVTESNQQREKPA